MITSVISFGLPLLRKCTPCPESDPDAGIECPRPPGMYGNYVNVRYNLVMYVLSLCSLDVVLVHPCLIIHRMQFYCSNNNEYNDLATIFFNTQVWIGS